MLPAIAILGQLLGRLQYRMAVLDCMYIHTYTLYILIHNIELVQLPGIVFVAIKRFSKNTANVNMHDNNDFMLRIALI